MGPMRDRRSLRGSAPEGSGFLSAAAKEEDGNTNEPHMRAYICLRFNHAQFTALLRPFGMDVAVIETPRPTADTEHSSHASI